MRNRSVIMVIILSFITFGIYSLYWFVSTKDEMNQLGADIPTGWLIIIPFVNLWWMWKYSEGVEQVSRGKLGGAVTFLLLWLLGVIGMAIVQATFNDVPPAHQPSLPQARVA